MILGGNILHNGTRCMGTISWHNILVFTVWWEVICDRRFATDMKPHPESYSNINIFVTSPAYFANNRTRCYNCSGNIVLNDLVKTNGITSRSWMRWKFFDGSLNLKVPMRFNWTCRVLYLTHSSLYFSVNCIGMRLVVYLWNASDLSFGQLLAFRYALIMYDNNLC